MHQYNHGNNCEPITMATTVSLQNASYEKMKDTLLQGNGGSPTDSDLRRPHRHTKTIYTCTSTSMQRQGDSHACTAKYWQDKAEYIPICTALAVDSSLLSH